MKRIERAILLIPIVGSLLTVTSLAQRGTPNPIPTLSDDYRREVERFFVQTQNSGRGGGPVIVASENSSFTAGAWWTNKALVDRLGLTDDQKNRIERAFENHRVRIVSTTEALEKEEAQLKQLLQAEPLDRNAVFSQVDRVILARGEMERENAAMTLEMREVLTRAQWVQLPDPSANLRVMRLPAGAGGRGARSGGQRGTVDTPFGTVTPGQRRGPGQQ
jgi:Spy/CpxP family protein refolding chaperone